MDRGRGDAEMGYGEEPNEQQDKFKDDTVDGSPRRAPTPGDLLAIEKVDPEAGPDAMAERDRAREFSDTEQAATWKRTISPRHRGIVGRYFTDPPEPPAPEKK